MPAHTRIRNPNIISTARRRRHQERNLQHVHPNRTWNTVCRRVRRRTTHRADKTEPAVFLDLARQGNYHHHDYNGVRNDLYPQHLHSHLVQHRHHPYGTAVDHQQQHHQRFSSQQPTVVQYHQQQQSSSSDMTPVAFDAELCAREIVSSPRSSTGSSTVNNAANNEDHHSSVMPTMTVHAASDSQP